MKDVQDLLWLSHQLGDPENGLAILAEGNASCRVGDRFWVKASGHSLQGLDESGLVQIDLLRAVSYLGGPDLSDGETRNALEVLAAGRALPSVETFVHAYLLSLPGVVAVGHTHPIALLSLLCREESATFATQRLFPDEIVCCGPESAFVPYTDPGLPLARAIKESVEEYIGRRGEIPRTIWLGNHGLIALGETVREVLGAHLMSEKAAKVRLGALSSGANLKPLTTYQIDRIHHRPDEHYRQQLLRQLSVK